MTTINLKDFYYWYLSDELVEVPDEVAEELMASKRREAAHAERVRYNKAYLIMNVILFSAIIQLFAESEVRMMCFTLWVRECSFKDSLNKKETPTSSQAKLFATCGHYN